MERDPKALEGAFCSKGLTFVCEGKYQDLVLPNAINHQCRNAQDILSSCNNLPDLSGAPIASWLLARVARLAGKRFPYSYGEVQGSDSATCWVRYFVLTGASKPVGILSLSGSTQGISLWLSHTNDVDPEQCCTEFLMKLLETPGDVARCRIVSVYTELTDKDARFSLPRVYGWDGKRFLNETAPEHALESEGDFD